MVTASPLRRSVRAAFFTGMTGLSQERLGCAQSDYCARRVHVEAG
jgi:hypothetical protein